MDIIWRHVCVLITVRIAYNRVLRRVITSWSLHSILDDQFQSIVFYSLRERVWLIFYEIRPSYDSFAWFKIDLVSVIARLVSNIIVGAWVSGHNETYLVKAEIGNQSIFKSQLIGRSIEFWTLGQSRWVYRKSLRVPTIILICRLRNDQNKGLIWVYSVISCVL